MVSYAATTIPPNVFLVGEVQSHSLECWKPGREDSRVAPLR